MFSGEAGLLSRYLRIFDQRGAFHLDHKRARLRKFVFGHPHVFTVEVDLEAQFVNGDMYSLRVPVTGISFLT